MYEFKKMKEEIRDDKKMLIMCQVFVIKCFEAGH